MLKRERESNKIEEQKRDFYSLSPFSQITSNSRLRSICGSIEEIFDFSNSFNEKEKKLERERREKLQGYKRDISKGGGERTEKNGSVEYLVGCKKFNCSV